MGKCNLGSADSYAQYLERFAEFDYIDQALAKKLIGAVGLRNVLIHEYASIDPQKLYDFFDDLALFIKAVGDDV